MTIIKYVWNLCVRAKTAYLEWCKDCEWPWWFPIFGTACVYCILTGLFLIPVQ